MLKGRPSGLGRAPQPFGLRGRSPPLTKRSKTDFLTQLPQKLKKKRKIIRSIFCKVLRRATQTAKKKKHGDGHARGAKDVLSPPLLGGTPFEAPVFSPARGWSELLVTGKRTRRRRRGGPAHPPTPFSLGSSALMHCRPPPFSQRREGGGTGEVEEEEEGHTFRAEWDAGCRAFGRRWGRRGCREETEDAGCKRAHPGKPLSPSLTQSAKTAFLPKTSKGKPFL